MPIGFTSISPASYRLKLTGTESYDTNTEPTLHCAVCTKILINWLFFCCQNRTVRARIDPIGNQTAI